MFRSYIIAAFRNLKKSLSFSLLNISGLAIGIACAGLIFLWVKDELTFNNYFKNEAHLYRINNAQTYDGQTFVFSATPDLLAASVKQEIPGIKNTARASWKSPKPFTKGDNSITESGYFVDPSFLQMFHLQFLEGNASDALNDLKSVVITDEMATRLFGKEDAMGKEIRTEKNELFKVTGVIKKLPKNTSFDFDWLAPFQNFENENPWLQGWGNNGVLTFVETSDHADVANINRQLYDYLKSKGPDYISKFSIYPMSRWNLYGQFDKSGREIEGKIKYVRLFSIIAWIILIIACINFMNLSTARSEQRSREVGVRKVLGAARGSLRVQFLVESLLMAILATVIAVVIIIIALPSFNTLVEKSLVFSPTDWTNWVAFTAIALICGLLAGSYPSFYLASFNPVTVLKGLKKREGSTGFVRKGLVIMQFSISIMLIIATIIIYKQIILGKDRDLGYNKNDLVYVQLQGNLKEQFTSVRNELLNSGVVENVGITNGNVLNYGSNTGDFEWPGKDQNKHVLVTISSINSSFIPTVGYKIIEGRNFYDDMRTDSSNVIINETMARLLNTKQVIGSKIGGRGEEPSTVVGVVKDFIYNDMYSAPAPMIFFPDPASASLMFIRTKHDVPLDKSVAQITSTLKKINPGYPVDIRFLNADFERFFQTETLIGKLASVFSILAIFISCLGLFGLSAYTAEKRSKEIGIRKVLGANERMLAALLSKDFLILVAISCLVAFPVAWWTMDHWLADFEYRIAISWSIFLFAGLAAMIIALFTVSFQAIRTAMKNPVVSIKSE